MAAIGNVRNAAIAPANAQPGAAQRSNATAPSQVKDGFTPAPASAVGKPGAAAPQSILHFDANPQVPEIQQFAQERGWSDKGWSQVSVFSQDLVYTTDNWKTTQVLHSSSEPSPLVNGRWFVPVPPGSNVQFALH